MPKLALATVVVLALIGCEETGQILDALGDNYQETQCREWRDQCSAAANKRIYACKAAREQCE